MDAEPHGGPETAREFGVPGDKLGNGKQPVTLDQIKQVKDVVDSEEVYIPEWGFAVKIRGLRRGELGLLYKDVEAIDAEVLNARVLSAAMVEPKMTEEEAAEILDLKGFKATKRIEEAILKASGLQAGFLSGTQSPIR
jgi:hypothetical protein